MAKKNEVPDLVLLAASDGDRVVIVRPDQVAQFLTQHWSQEWVSHNTAFDFRVLERAIYPDTLRGVVDEGRWHDTMLLDQLVRIGNGDAEREGVFRRGLAVVAKEWVGIDVDKLAGSLGAGDPYRLRYHEIKDREDEWPTLEPGWFEYAGRDAWACVHSYPALKAEGERIFDSAGLTPENVNLERWGLLTEAIQVRASLVLAEAGSIGLAIDEEKALAARTRLLREIREQQGVMQATEAGIFDYVGASRVAKTGKSGAPQINQKVLARVLNRIAEELCLDIPSTPTGRMSLALDVWRSRAKGHPFIRAWTRFADLGKLLTFFERLKLPKEETNLFESFEPSSRIFRESVTSSYEVVVRTGRTSCRDDNLQQFPRDPWFRQMFTARPGHKLVICDFSAIELVTLAAVLETRYGYSVLADVLRDGRDPHAYTASLVLGIDPEDWEQFAKESPAKAKEARQAAKAINFGVPGGLMPQTLAVYAEANYGVKLSPEKATEFRERLIGEVYPELTPYLAQDPLLVICRNLGCQPAAFRQAAGFKRKAKWLGEVVKKVLRGQPWKADGTAYEEAFIFQIWEGLRAGATGVPQWVDEALTLGQGTSELEAFFLKERAVTLTGRVRSGIEYTQARNTPFQGLAGDGGKEALWRLWLDGWQVRAFVHDEIITEIVDRGNDLNHDAGVRIAGIMSKAMEDVIGGRIPVKVAWEVSGSWEKP